jgi:hypothetical protein
MEVWRIRKKNCDYIEGNKKMEVWRIRTKNCDYIE